jgi:hypothetical protein
MVFVTTFFCSSYYNVKKSLYIVPLCLSVSQSCLRWICTCLCWYVQIDHIKSLHYNQMINPTLLYSGYILYHSGSYLAVSRHKFCCFRSCILLYPGVYSVVSSVALSCILSFILFLSRVALCCILDLFRITQSRMWGIQPYFAVSWYIFSCIQTALCCIWHVFCFLRSGTLPYLGLFILLYRRRTLPYPNVFWDTQRSACCGKVVH